MRRFPVSVASFCSFVLILALSACGGSNSKNTTAAKSVTLTPTVLSMNRGDVFQATAKAFEGDGSTGVAADLTFATSNSNIASVSTAGNVCAGKWDANYVVCTPATTTGTATITVTLTKLPSATATTTVYVHEKVDRVQLNTVNGSCISSGQSQVLTAVAQSTNPTVCASLGGSVPCTIPPTTLGQFTFSASDADVISVDNSTGTATAATPGLTNVFASVSNVNSAAQPMLVCPITQLIYKNGDTNDTAPFTFAKAATKNMIVTAIDSAGVTLTNPPVAYISSNAYAISAAPSTTASTGVLTGVNSGTTSLTFAECAPPSCNKHLQPVYSAPIQGTVSGTYNAPTLYAASTKSLNLIPIDTSNNTAGTAITLPYLPNSFQMNHQGTKALLGSDGNPLMVLDPTNGQVLTFAGITGAKVLSMSPDGTFSLVSNSAGTFVINLGSNNSVVNTNAGRAIQGEFSPDSRFAFFTTGGPTLYVLDLSSGKTLTYNEQANIADLAVLANGPLTYLAQPGAINAVPNCNLQTGGIVDTQAATAPSTMATVPNGSGVLAIDGSTLRYVKTTTVTQACPPAATESTVNIPFTFASGTPKQLITDYSGAHAVISSSGTQVAVADLGAATSKSVTLGASATVAGVGDITADSVTYYVGGSDNTIHKIDLASGADTAQITVSLKDANSAVVAPDLVAVRNK